jgi:acyl-CoA dehydrogenase
MMRVFIDHCIQQHMDGELDATDAAIAKLQSTEMLSDVLDECLQLHGGYGYMWGIPDRPRVGRCADVTYCRWHQ